MWTRASCRCRNSDCRRPTVCRCSCWIRNDSFGTSYYHVIDYVNISGPDSIRNLNAEIADYTANNANIGLWNTNLVAGSTLPYAIPNGVANQVYYSQNPRANGANTLAANNVGTWRSPAGGKASDGIAALNAFFNPNHIGTGTDLDGHTSTATNLDLAVQVPFTPTRVTYQYISWQANDPLVHYFGGDMNFTGSEPSGLQTGIHQFQGLMTNLPANNLGKLNDRYQPWGRALAFPNMDGNPFNLRSKDPLVRQSDNWDFPTNKLPGIGWLGRVHRGTPWQTVYLKSSDVLGEIVVSGTPPNATTNYLGTNTWEYWTGNFNPISSTYTAPVQDRMLFDLFTTAFDDNATRGTLSINVGPTNANLAAWSAVLSGVVVLTNTTVNPANALYPLTYSWLTINPAGVYNPTLPLARQPGVVQIVDGINQTRSDTNLFPRRAFEHVGDILRVPQFTVSSPFLNVSTEAQITNGITEEMYEWLPQQTLSLLRVSGTPESPMRYVIYCYGQTLKPAPNGIYSGGGPYFGMITNYQVVSEIATRAVVRFNSTLTNAIGTNTVYNIDTGLLTTNWTGIPAMTNNSAVIENFNLLPPD